MKKKFLFRCDSSNDIGSGHLKRCLNLACELYKRECEIIFLVRELEGNLNINIPFFYKTLKIEQVKNYKELKIKNCELSQESDAICCVKKIISNKYKNIDYVVVDNYRLDHIWEETFTKEALKNNLIKDHQSLKIIAIDDLADRRHSADYLIDPNYFGEFTQNRYNKLINKNCIKLLGPIYAIISKDYLNFSEIVKKRNSLKRVLIFFGGHDSNKLTLKTFKALNSGKLKKLELDIVIGNNLKEEKEIIFMAKQRGNSFIHKNLPSLSYLMVRADIFIGTGGTTTWERNILKLPGVIITDGLNQELSNKILEKNKNIHLIGNSKKVKISDIRNTILDIYREKIHLRHPEKLTDGFGSHRIADILLGKRKTSYLYPIINPEELSFYFSKLIGLKNRDLNNYKNKNSLKFIVEKDTSDLPINLISYSNQLNNSILIHEIFNLLKNKKNYFNKETIKIIFSFFKNNWIKKNISTLKEKKFNKKELKITIISGKYSWINNYIPNLIDKLWLKNHSIKWVNSKSKLSKGDCCFIIDFNEIFTSKDLTLNKNSLVIKEINTTFENNDKIINYKNIKGFNISHLSFLLKDIRSGTKIYKKEKVKFIENELLKDFNLRKADAINKIFTDWIDNYVGNK